jgi:hypothetical protein
MEETRISERGPFDAFNDDVSDPMYAPMLTTDPLAYGLPDEVSTHKPYPEEHDGDWWGATANQEYITPSIGGKVGPSVGYGWTTGIKPRKQVRSPLDGRTLVVAPGQANNPNVGQVGRDGHADRLAAGVAALNTDFLPPMDVISASFIGAGTSNPLVREMRESGIGG